MLQEPEPDVWSPDTQCIERARMDEAFRHPENPRQGNNRHPSLSHHWSLASATPCFDVYFVAGASWQEAPRGNRWSAWNRPSGVLSSAPPRGIPNTVLGLDGAGNGEAGTGGEPEG